MDSYFLLLGIPATAGVLAGSFPGWVRRYPQATGNALALIFFAGAFLLLGRISNESETLWSVPWVPDLGVSFSLRLTAFSAWFGFLILFLGGWLPPVDIAPFNWVPGVVWFILKMGLMFFMFAMTKVIVPRYRYDQLMRLGWKVFLPLSLGWVVLTAGFLQYFGMAS